MAESHERTLAILSAGEMGSALGSFLIRGGARVLTWSEGRGQRTIQRAHDAGMQPLEALDDVVRQSSVILSVVPPAAAEPLAQRVAAVLSSTGVSPIYVDANSIGPETARSIARCVEGAGGRFVDGALIGSASALAERTELILAGPTSREVASLLVPLRITVLEQVGDASAYKVLYAGLTKGLAALGVELLSGAERLGLREQLLNRYQADHPGVSHFWQQVLPGLAPRAGRRAQEMVELAAMLTAVGIDSSMAPASQQVLEGVAERHARTPGPDDGTIEGFLAWLVDRPARPEES